MTATEALTNAVQGAIAGGAADPMAWGAGASGAAPFSGVLQSMVAETNQLSDRATAAVTGLLDGSGVEIHDAMIATQKASMAFELALQVRNKAVGAYQQMMGMQF
jgi:flagellar hook-basal body complex protein FliE